MESIRTHGAFTALTSSEQLDALLNESSGHAVAIFKHSPSCGTSAQAYDELEAFLADENAQVFIVNVLSHRPLAQAIAARFHVRHESPQVLVLRNGEVRWHGSHYRVSAKNVSQAMLAANTP